MNGGNVTALAGEFAAGVGGGQYGYGGTVIVNGGTLYAKAKAVNNDLYVGGAGIGGGEDRHGGDMTINGGTVTAIGATGGAAAIAGNLGANIMLADDDSRVEIVRPLTGGARFGVTDQYLSAEDGVVQTVTAGLPGKGDCSAFFSDSGDFVIRTDANGEAALCYRVPFGTPDLILPADLTRVEAEAFEGIAASVVEITAGCAGIGRYAFRNCANLTQIRFPAGCLLAEGVFDGCGKVYVYSEASSPAEAYCNDPAHENCVFVAETQD